MAKGESSSISDSVTEYLGPGAGLCGPAKHSYMNVLTEEAQWWTDCLFDM